MDELIKELSDARIKLADVVRLCDVIEEIVKKDGADNDFGKKMYYKGAIFVVRKIKEVVEKV